MEFKGTKGKCRFELTGHTVIYSDCDIDLLDGTDVLKHEVKYNALVMSKAPEMLEMLKRVLKCRILTEMSNNHPIKKEIEQLIKESTEL